MVKEKANSIRKLLIRVKKKYMMMKKKDYKSSAIKMARVNNHLTKL